MPDTTITKVDSTHSPKGAAGQKYLACGKSMSMRLWENESAEKDQTDTKRDYETIGFVIKGKAELHLEGQMVLLNAGDSWVVPKGANHHYKVLDEFSAVESTSPPAELHDRAESEKGFSAKEFFEAGAKDAASVKPVKAAAGSSESEKAMANTEVEEGTDAKPEAKADPKNGAKPEAKPEGKPEATSEAKPEAKCEAKPEAKAEGTPEAKSEAKPEAKSEAKPEAKSEAKPEAKCEAKPEANAEAKPEAKCEAKPEAKCEAKPEDQPKAAGGDDKDEDTDKDEDKDEDEDHDKDKDKDSDGTICDPNTKECHPAKQESKDGKEASEKAPAEEEPTANNAQKAQEIAAQIPRTDSEPTSNSSPKEPQPAEKLELPASAQAARQESKPDNQKDDNSKEDEKSPEGSK